MVGLSALMTTTVPAMEDTIKALRKDAPWVKVMVGGAVLTQEYADAIGADAYCKDAMASVNFATSVIGEASKDKMIFSTARSFIETWQFDVPPQYACP